MVRFAPVCPPAMLMDLKEKGVLGNYHLLLAHDIADNEALYREVFHDIQGTIIMDNSTVELGHPVELDVMLRAKAIVHADLVVLPDYLGEMQRTIDASKSVALEWMQAGLGPFMAVPQGQTHEEVVRCAQAHRNLPSVTAWGIPRHCTELFGTRMGVIKAVRMVDHIFSMHLLGFSENMHDDLVCSRVEYISGIDSAVPVRLGLHDIKISQVLSGHPPRGDYWDTATVANDQVLENLKLIRSWISDRA